MYELFTQLMSGFTTDNPLEYIAGYLLAIVLIGVFFRLLYTLFKPY